MRIRGSWAMVSRRTDKLRSRGVQLQTSSQEVVRTTSQSISQSLRLVVSAHVLGNATNFIHSHQRTSSGVRVRDELHLSYPLSAASMTVA